MHVNDLISLLDGTANNTHYHCTCHSNAGIAGIPIFDEGPIRVPELFPVGVPAVPGSPLAGCCNALRGLEPARNGQSLCSREGLRCSIVAVPISLG